MDKDFWGEQPKSVLDEIFNEDENQNENDKQNENEPVNENQETDENQAEAENAPKEPTAEEEREIERQAANRHQRRMESKIQSQREEIIALNERLRAREEAAKKVSEEADQIFEKIYGNEDPTAREASATLKEYLDKRFAQDKAEREAEREEREVRESQLVAEEEGIIEDMMDEVEDAYPEADFSNRDIRRGFINALEKLSPKDENGNVREYADPMGAWEFYQSQKAKSQSRAKEYASRGMAKSGGATANEAQIKQKEVEKQLFDAGVI